MIPETTNSSKHQTRNPVLHYLLDKFYLKAKQLVGDKTDYETGLDAGCGEGFSLRQLSGCLPKRMAAFDINDDCVSFCKEEFPAFDIRQSGIYDIPWNDDAFDLVICFEVLEHLEDPIKALSELLRVCNGTIIISVPFEPWFQICNFLRGKYLSRWGNHPEHINHWNKTTFKNFLSGSGNPVEVVSSFPWLFAKIECLNH